jgi:hypothetical protein
MYGDPTKSRLETLSYDSVVAVVGPKTKTKTKNGKRTFIMSSDFRLPRGGLASDMFFFFFFFFQLNKKEVKGQNVYEI